MNIRLIGLTSAIVLLGCAEAVNNMYFNRIASFAVIDNMADGEDKTRETSPEIIAASSDGMTLVYTDSPLKQLGLVDISDPSSPAPLGNIPMDGEPTSVAVLGNTAYVGVNTSGSYTDPSGNLISVDMKTKTIGSSCDLGGQPDSIATSPDGTFIAVAIENERDEDLGDGTLPQLPAGDLVLVDLDDGKLDCSSMRRVDLTGLAKIGPSDPEPEFVDINDNGEIVVTLQENNHIVIVERDGDIRTHFSAGSVDLVGIDTVEEGALTFNKSQIARKREPDSVKWIDNKHFVTANEGDYEGGSRSWTIFKKNGDVIYESNISFEQAVIEIGHYPEKRSGNKGVEPEAVETAIFDGVPLVFIGSERGGVIGVYDVSDMTAPVLRQLLPSGAGPESFAAIPSRNLLVSANEKDLLKDGGPRAHVMIYDYSEAAPTYPMLTSKGMDHLTGWGALSGLVADTDGSIYAVNDGFYEMQPTIFKIDASTTPARIVKAIPIMRKGGYPAQKLDMEGIALDGKGGFWVASEGSTDKLRTHAIFHINAKGLIKDEIALPPELQAVSTSKGAEGIIRIDNTLWIALQRSWKDDPENHVKLVSYNIKTKEWGAVHYPMDTSENGKMSISEISVNGNYAYLIERDNQSGSAAVTKKIYRVAVFSLHGSALGSDLPVVFKEKAHDLLPDLASTGGFILNKVEGLAIQDDGTAWIVTDNDGVDDHSGETMFMSIGKIE